MAAVTGTVVKNRVIDNIALGRVINNVKCLMIETASTVDNGDSFTVDLANYGGSTLLGALAVRHTTDNSVIVAETLTTSVSTTTVTVTITGATANKKRVIKLFFE